MFFRREAKTRHEAKQPHGIIIVCIRTVIMNKLPALAGHYTYPYTPPVHLRYTTLLCKFRDSCSKPGQRATINESKQTEKGVPHDSGTEEGELKKRA